MYQLTIQNGPWRGRRVTVRAGDLTVGSGPESDLRVMLGGLAARHARLQADATGVRIEAVDGAPLSVNGRSGPAFRLSNRDRIVLGPLRLGFRGASSGPARRGRRILSGLRWVGASAIVLAMGFQFILMIVLRKMSLQYVPPPPEKIEAPVAGAPAPEEKPPTDPAAAEPPKDEEPLWPQPDAARKILF
jgi:hypothetical protein